MNAVDIINKKRLGERLTAEEIEYMVMGYTEGVVPDYQMSALLMAICCKGLSKEETVDLTRIMKDSGDTVDLSGITGPTLGEEAGAPAEAFGTSAKPASASSIKVDKHSTGGVGDKTTLIVAPIAAACGVPIAKMSGRGLGFTGGTVDKMESIPGFKTTMEQDEFIKAVNTIGIAVIGQTGRIAPADKKIYALRDVTATTENIGLITSSIMSKKLAAGADAIVLDVKCGGGAFMKKYEDAKELAEWMVDIGRASGKKMMAIISDMNQPLGNAVGNALEVCEAIDVLKCKGPKDITELSINLAGAMIYLGEKTSTLEAGKERAEEALKNGSALTKFREFVNNQGGNPDITEDAGLLQNTCTSDAKSEDVKAEILGRAKDTRSVSGTKYAKDTNDERVFKQDVLADVGGYVSRLDAMGIGLASQHAGAGRQCKDDEIDMAAGIVLRKKLGDKVDAGEVLCTVYGREESKLSDGVREAKVAYTISDKKPEKPRLIKHIIT